MKNLFLAAVLFAATAAFGGVPAMSVVVSDASGKAAFKGATKANGAFATEKLQPGKYVVQFNSKNAALKGGQYSIVVAAGKKKVVANAIAGEKFLAGGVAMKVEVGAGLNITGQIAAGPMANVPSQTNDNTSRPRDQQESVRRSLPPAPDKMPVPTGY